MSESVEKAGVPTSSSRASTSGRSSAGTSSASTTTTSAQGGRAPWIVAGVAGVVLVALLVVYFVVFLPYRRDHRDVGALTPDEQSALTAATTELNNIGSLGGKGSFDHAYADAIAGATGAFRKDLLSEQATAKKNLAGNGVQVQVTQRALVGPVTKNGQHGYVVLMDLTGPQTSVSSLLLAPQQVSVTVVQVGGKWLVDDIASASVT